MSKQILEAEQSVVPTYSRFPLFLTKGEGMYLFDEDGKKYLDFAAGIAVMALGYNQPDYMVALQEQAGKLIHCSNLFYNEWTGKAATYLTKASGMDQAFFTNSGTEAIEGALKLARAYAYKERNLKGGEIIAMNSSFHGRSMGALAVTGQKKYQEPFEPLIGGVKFANFNDLESVKTQINGKTCAIILEPIQGEGGIHPATKEFLTGVKKICEEKDIVLIFDEIQCGMGRSGAMFTYQKYGVQPDIVTCAKALGCGLPVGAFAANTKVAKGFAPGDHGTTYGGNPLVTAMVCKVFELFKKLEVVNNVNRVSAYLEQQLEQLVVEHDIVIERRGMGLIQGLELKVPAKDILNKVMDQGLILISAGSNVLRFVPPLIVTEKEVDEMIMILKKAL